MEERVLKILEEINEDIITYDGDNMYDEGVISSIDVIEIISELENEFDIEIDAMYADEEYFANNLEEMRRVTSLLSANSFVVWLYIALYISQRKNFDDYITLANEIFLDSNVWQEFGLEKKSIVFSEIKKYVEEKFAKEES